jgi:regulator of sigma E protease
MLGNLLGIVNFVIIFGILVFFHELGHFAAAKFFKMRVHEFALGMFRPKLRLFHDGETEYTIRAIPLGGFVRIAGMQIDDGDVPEEMLQEDEDVPPKDRFNNRPVFQRYLVILAGPVASLLLGYIALVAQMGMIGVPTGNVTTQIHSVTLKQLADKAGIQPGERVVKMDGVAVSDGKVVMEKLRSSPEKPLALEIASTKGETRTVNLTPLAVQDDGKTVGRIGVVMEEERRPVTTLEAMKYGVLNVGVWLKTMGKIFAQGKAKEALGGPIGIFAAVKEARAQGLPIQLELLGQLSLSLAFFNLLPIPALDGGHLMLLTLEAIRGRKLTGRQTMQVTTVGLVFLGTLFLYVMYNDIARLFFRKG